MRLINTETGRFEEFVDLSKTPPYAILSHTWDADGEQSYQDVAKIQEKYSSIFCDEAVLADLRQKAADRVLESEDLSAPELYKPPYSTVSILQEPVISFSLSAPFLQSLLISILAQVVLRFLLGVSIPSWPGPQIEVQTHPLPPFLPSIWNPDSGLSEKVRRACAVARHDGYRYIWVDSSCIDKTSSSELSEAINSMFNWYRDAQVCYAFLVDVPSDEDVRAWGSKFQRSRWFTRSWTLQELIAPYTVVFLSHDWEPLGTKDSLADLIQRITYIDLNILTHESKLDDESVAERMHWASKRQATRVEDEAYSLLGIFGLKMPTLYGEGPQAFQRLQEEILQRIPDQSLFAWGDHTLPISEIRLSRITKGGDHNSPFALSPRSFNISEGRIASVCLSESLQQLPIKEYTFTPYGVCTQLCLLPLQAFDSKLCRTEVGKTDGLYLAILGSDIGNAELLSRLCYTTTSHSFESSIEFLYTASPRASSIHHPSTSLVRVSVEDLVRVQTSGQWQTKMVYLPRPDPPAVKRRLDESHTELRLSLPTTTQLNAALRQPYGYTISQSDLLPPKHSSNSHSFTLLNATSKIHIQHRYMSGPITCGSSTRYIMGVEARIWIFSTVSHEDFQGLVETVRNTPPYTSVIWTDERPWTMTLPPRTVHLVTDSGEIMLQFGLAIVASSHYRISVEVVSNDRSTSVHELSTRDMFLNVPLVRKPPKYVKLTMLGSVRRSLERRGYSVHQLEDSVTCKGGSYSLLLCHTEFGFNISIKYFYTFRIDAPSLGTLVFAARVTLQSGSASVSASCSDGPEKPQDGPNVVLWHDFYSETFDFSWIDLPWRSVGLTAPNGDSLKLRLCLELAWESEYYLLIDIERDQGPSLQDDILQGIIGLDQNPLSLCLIREPHASITLTLPGHVERALWKKGYSQVSLEEPTRDHPDSSLLMFSNANITIAVEYFHNLSIDSDGKQGLSFQACVRVSSESRVPNGITLTTNHGYQTTKWNAWVDIDQGGWCWELPWEDVKLTTPSGLELTLRLGFYLVWPGEYCITVEVNPQSPSSRPESLNVNMVEASPSDPNGAEEADDNGGRQEMAMGKAAVVALELGELPFWGVEDSDMREDGDHGKSPETLIQIAEEV